MEPGTVSGATPGDKAHATCPDGRFPIHRSTASTLSNKDQLTDLDRVVRQIEVMPYIHRGIHDNNGRSHGDSRALMWSTMRCMTIFL